MTANQIIRIHTAAGVEEIDADRYRIENDEYVLLRGDEEIRRIPCAEIVQEGESSGIETVFSRG